MSTVGQREILTQRRVLALFLDVLGYAYLGHWKDRPDNGNVEEALLTDWLTRQGHNDTIIGKVLFELDKAANIGGSKTLYDANRGVYGLFALRREGQAGGGRADHHRLADRLGTRREQRFRHR